MERRFPNQTDSSSSSAHVIRSDVPYNNEEGELSLLGAIDNSYLVSRLNSKLKFVVQKMSILEDNAEELNIERSEVRSFAREVLLQKKLKQND